MQGFKTTSTKHFMILLLLFKSEPETFCAGIDVNFIGSGGKFRYKKNKTMAFYWVMQMRDQLCFS